MPGIASRRLEPYRAERERYVVNKHQNVVELDFLLILPVAHSIARKIHICGWLENNNLLVLYAPLGHIAVAPGGEAQSERIRQCVSYAEADVMAGSIIFGAYISESYNKMLHYNK